MYKCLEKVNLHTPEDITITSKRVSIVYGRNKQ